MTDNLPCSGRPLTAITEESIMKMNKIVPENCHASMKELDSEVKILCGMTQHIVIDILGM